MNLKTYYTNSQTDFPVDISLRNLVRRAILAALEYEKFVSDCEVSVTFTDNEGIRALNKAYRNKDSATDVLSFPMYDFRAGEAPEEGFPAELGDIVISLERADEQAGQFGHSFKREVSFLTVHSVLHLLGYDHELSPEDEEDMIKRQKDIMKILKIDR